MLSKNIKNVEMFLSFYHILDSFLRIYSQYLLNYFFAPNSIICVLVNKTISRPPPQSLKLTP